VAWLLPELEVGLDPELKLLEPLEFELDEDEPEEVEPEELEEPEEVEPEEVEPDEVEPEADEPEVVEDVPDDDVAVLCVDPGRVRATAPATATLAKVTAVVVERTLARPCSLAVTARRMPSRFALLMDPILRSGFWRSLEVASAFPMRVALFPSSFSAGYGRNMKDD